MKRRRQHDEFATDHGGAHGSFILYDFSALFRFVNPDLANAASLVASDDLRRNV